MICGPINFLFLSMSNNKNIPVRQSFPLVYVRMGRVIEMKTIIRLFQVVVSITRVYFPIEVGPLYRWPLNETKHKFHVALGTFVLYAMNEPKCYFPAWCYDISGYYWISRQIDYVFCECFYHLNLVTKSKSSHVISLIMTDVMCMRIYFISSLMADVIVNSGKAKCRTTSTEMI